MRYSELQCSEAIHRAVERMGFSVKIVEGDERNIKVTTPTDLKIAEMLLEELP